MRQETYEKANLLQCYLKDIEALEKHLRLIDTSGCDMRLVCGDFKDGDYQLVSGYIKLRLIEAMKTQLSKLKKELEEEFANL